MTTFSTRWALPKPEATDLIQNGYDAIADLADALDLALPRVVSKAAAQSVVNSTVLVNDTHLFLDLAAGYIYELVAHLAVSGNPTGDFKAAWTNTGTIALVGSRGVLGMAPAATTLNGATLNMPAAAGLATAIQYGLDTSGNIALIREEMLISCTVAGRITLQWAQNVANAVSSTVWNSSWLRAMPVQKL